MADSQEKVLGTQPKYDGIASKYAEFIKDYVVQPIIDYSFYECMLQPLLDTNGLLTGKRVLDLACGEGIHTRRLKELNCAYILGVDISAAMVDLARQIELQDPKGIDYIVADVKQLPPPEQPFDLVAAFFLLNYARTREELLQMAKVIYAQLGEDKQFISVTPNVVAGQAIFNQYIYGITAHTEQSFEGGLIPDGTELIITLHNKRDEPECTFSCYYHSADTYEQVFKEAGFKSIEWVPLKCDPNLPNKEFYNDYIKSPDSIGLIVKK